MKKRNNKISPIALLAFLMLGTVNIAFAQDITTGLQGFWKFENNLNDQSSNVNSAVIHGAGVSYVQHSNPCGNTALSFNGTTGSYLTIANNSAYAFGTGPFTVAMEIQYLSPQPWTNNDANGVNGGYYSNITDKIDPGCPGGWNGICMFLDYAPPGMAGVAQGRTQATNPYTVNTSNSHLNDGSWHCLVFTREPDLNGTTCTLKMYVDATLNSTASGVPLNNVTNTTDIYIGTNSCNQTIQRFAGQLDNYRLYNRALTPADIQSMCNCSSCASCFHQGGEKVTNGNFSTGNSGFTSALPSNCTCAGGSYCVINDAFSKCGNFYHVYDHTSPNTGKFMVIDGDANLARDIYSSTVSMQAGKIYTIAFWVYPGLDVYAAGASTPNLQVYAGATPVGTLVNGSTLTAGTWNPVTITYNGSAATSITIRQTNFGFLGFDYGIDDISVTECIPNLTVSAGEDRNICLGNCALLSVNNASLTSTWYSISGASSTQIGTGNSISVCPTSGTCYKVISIDASGCTAVDTVCVNVTTAVPAGTVHFVSAPADGCVGGSATVCVNAVTGATFYNWSATPCITYGPYPGTPGPFQSTTPCVQINYTCLPPGSGWSVCCFAGNPCGNTNSICTWIRAKLSEPLALTGNKIACANTSATYCIPNPGVGGAATYVWTITGDADINGAAPTYTTTAGVLCVTVNFHTGWTSGTLCVHAVNSCGQVSPDRCITFSSAPVQPPSISGAVYVCPGTTYSYSVGAVANACSYEWTCNVPGSSVIQNMNSCSITFPSPIPSGGFQVCVRALSCCGVPGPWRCKGIAGGLPNIPGNIQGSQYGMCCVTGASYFIFPAGAPPATSYKWTIVGTGASINGPDYLSGVTIDFNCPFTSIILCVHAINACGSSLDRCITIYGKPGPLCAITGATSVCHGDVVTYCTCAIPGVTNYVWTVPPSATIISNNGLLCITVMWGTIGGNITVMGSNPCGTTAIKTLAVNVVCRQSQVQDNSPISLQVFPNPVTDNATLKFTAGARANYHLNLTDVLGQVVWTNDGSAIEGSNMIELNLATLSKGVYIVNLSCGNNSEQVRLVLQ
ncbi:MAG: LamG-like jellyroll fold domain-containing protein [Bacteroidota bacterium]